MSETIYLEEPLRSLWAGKDPFRVVDSLQGDVYRALEGRRTFRTELAGRACFVKLHQGVGWGEIVKNLLSVRLPVLGAGNEWRACRRLTALGVDTLHPIAFGERGGNPARRHSFLVTEELAPTVSLEDYCRNWHAVPPAPTFKWAVIQRVAEMVRRMHRGGVNHRDCYLCHFLLHLPAHAAAPRLSLIDLHRAQVRKHTPRRWRDKDLAALHFSSLDIGLTSRDRLRFLKTYCAPSPLRELLAQEKSSLDWLAGESLRLQERYRRKYAPEAAL